MPNPVARLVDGAIADLAARLAGDVTPAGTWFDGFWDFVVDNQDRLDRGPAWEIQNGESSGPWAVEVIASDDPARPQLELYLFVEAKDRRPGAGAPWPVATLGLGGDDPAEIGARDRFDRPHDRWLAQDLRGRGFAPLVGYWGLRCEALVARDDPRELDAVRATLAALPDALPIALALAARL